MAPKILLLKVSANDSLLEHKRAAQEFIAATNTVFFKAQGLATLALLHKMVFGLLEGLLEDWCLLNLDSIEWPCKAEVRQVCVNLWSLNKQAPWSAEFGKTVESSQQSAPCNKGKGKAKATEDDEDKEGEATQKLRKELEDFMVPTKFTAVIIIAFTIILAFAIFIIFVTIIHITLKKAPATLSAETSIMTEASFMAGLTVDVTGIGLGTGAAAIVLSAELGAVFHIVEGPAMGVVETTGTLGTDFGALELSMTGFEIRYEGPATDLNALFALIFSKLATKALDFPFPLKPSKKKNCNGLP
ncbi:hypothetical protein C0995_007621 [Termitomyces sp. Mi166|nr:hypothetical protein C0995_007621 [Termitomyces sp. Mi166\